LTGEFRLGGLVLPVGGIKVMGVAAAGAVITRVLLPARNRKDFGDIPDEVREGLSLIWLETVDDAVTAALEPEANASKPGPAGPTGR
jgi:ATP-dependent Lon protease